MTRISFFLTLVVAVATLTTQAFAAPACSVGGITNQQWLHPDPASQLGVVPVQGKFVPPAQKKSGTSVNCDFHIFSWQWFAYLMNPNAKVPGARNFEDRHVHPVVDLDTCASVTSGRPINQRTAHGLASSVLKLPDTPDQASGGALYDKNSNLVFYSRRFTQSECGLYKSGNFPDAGAPNDKFPTGLNQVLELKSSWRVMGANDDPSRYFVIEAEIEGIGQRKLGLVGFHIVINTKFHPEFIWATFEHIDNASDCRVAGAPPTPGFERPQPKAPNGWSFASAACNACIAANYQNGTDLKQTCASQCKFNIGNIPASYDNQGNAITKGTPSSICLDAHYGDLTPQPTNDDNIQFLNTLLVGPKGIITALPASDPMAVLKNYFLGGAQWSDVSKPNFKAAKFNQNIAGSKNLANSSLESFLQAGSSNTFYKPGCFSCHGGASYTNTARASHLLTSTQGAPPGLIDRCDVKAGPIADNTAAQSICPKVCQNAMGWNKNWKTIAGSSMSVCGCNACPQ